MKGVQKLKKIEENFEKILNFFFTKPIFSIIYELCLNLGYLRSLWKAPETKTWGGTPPDKVGLTKNQKWLKAANNTENVGDQILKFISLISQRDKRSRSETDFTWKSLSLSLAR